MLHISRAAKTTAAPIAGQSGTVMVAVFEHTFTTAFTAATDILEIGLMPAHARVVGATVIGTAGLGTDITADVGLMTGDQGANDDTRTLTGTEFFNDADIDANEANMTRAAALAVTQAEKHRGIGVELSANVTASAAKKITLVLEYVY
jgi:hypothetical protein